MELDNLSQRLKELLYGSGKTLATAESCTGGGIASAIVATSGSSDYFKGGIVSYCNEIKERLLGVDPNTIEQFNVVSAEVATEMCAGAMKVLQTDYAISITGAAGPSGGTDEIPVGTIWIGYGSEGDIRTFKMTDNLGRKKNLYNATIKALTLIIDYISLENAIK